MPEKILRVSRPFPQHPVGMLTLAGVSGNVPRALTKIGNVSPLQVKCYLGTGHEREEVTSIGVGGYFGETALLRDELTKVRLLDTCFKKEIVYGCRTSPIVAS